MFEFNYNPTKMKCTWGQNFYEINKLKMLSQLRE